MVQLTPKRDRGKKDRGFLQPEVEQPAAAGRACIVPCLISRDYKFKAANFEGFTPSQKAKFPPHMHRFSARSSPDDGEEGTILAKYFTLHQVNAREERRTTEFL